MILKKIIFFSFISLLSIVHASKAGWNGNDKSVLNQLESEWDTSLDKAISEGKDLNKEKPYAKEPYEYNMHQHQNYTLLEAVVDLNFPKLVQKLIDNGVNCTTQNAVTGETALSIAKRKKHTDIVDLLQPYYDQASEIR